MKLARIGNVDKEIPVLIDKDENYRDLSKVITDLNPEHLNFNTIEKIENLDLSSLSIIDKNQRIGACVKNPSKFTNTKRTNNFF